MVEVVCKINIRSGAVFGALFSVEGGRDEEYEDVREARELRDVLMRRTERFRNRHNPKGASDGTIA